MGRCEFNFVARNHQNVTFFGKSGHKKPFVWVCQAIKIADSLRRYPETHLQSHASRARAVTKTNLLLANSRR